MYSYTHYALQQIQSAPASEKKTKATKITCKVGRDESVALAPFLYFDFCLNLPHLTVSSRSADSIALRPTVSICHCDFFYLRYICNAAYYSHDSSSTDGRRMIETRDVHGSDRIVGFFGSDKSDHSIRLSEITNDFYVWTCPTSRVARDLENTKISKANESSH